MRDERRLVGAHRVAPLAAGHVGDAADDDPVLAAPVVELQRQRGAGLHLDALDLEAGAFLQHRVRAPGTGHRPVQPVRLVAARLQLADDVLDPLQVVAVRDQHRVGRVDDHEVLHADGGDDAVLGVHVGVAGRDGDALALPAVAVPVGADELGHRLPRPDVAPVEGAADDDDLALPSPPSPSPRSRSRCRAPPGTASRRSRAPPGPAAAADCSFCQHWRADASSSGAWRASAASTAAGVNANIPEFQT